MHVKVCSPAGHIKIGMLALSHLIEEIWSVDTASETLTALYLEDIFQVLANVLSCSGRQSD